MDTILAGHGPGGGRGMSVVTEAQLSEELGIPKASIHYAMASRKVPYTRRRRDDGYFVYDYDREAAIKAIRSVHSSVARRAQLGRENRTLYGRAEMRVVVTADVYDRIESAADQLGLTVPGYCRAAITAMLNRDGY